MYMRERGRERCCEDTQAVHVGEDPVDWSAPAGCVDTAWLVPHLAGLNAQIREDLCLYTGFVNVSDIYELVSTLGV